ncbi:NAD(P)/FAD-dependent oxidoreductase [Psychromarinibacter halotolerans]|uniref:NAD(P)/FAD-dependent oxidoreductase n=1 Tax=Psychromarinibacter halotolerans TaxID=1775175 RepID=A0ABV7GI01_9RHOB|nr:FAD-dependent oxidoreductase [Psychromarinibacter halotolerans]MDF0599042.1 FAD-dependent oxidoreductase [Psychromarinibacter halotolerans]
MTVNGTDRSVVIVGAGQAGSALAFRLREIGHQGPIALIGEEIWPPYQRPPLSKKYLTGELERDRLFLKPAGAYDEAGIELVLGRPVTGIDRAARRVLLAGVDNPERRYDILVLATGGSPRLPEDLSDPLPDNIFTLRGIGDADRMRASFAPGRRLLVVGGGYIGLELAAVARLQGLEVTLIEQAPRILGRVACAETADYFRELHTGQGVMIREGVAIAGYRGPVQRPSAVVLADGTEISFDLAVFGIGLVPNDALASEAGLHCDGGVLVDGWGRTSDPGIFAVGDCARLPLDGRMLRIESVHNAIAQAEHLADYLVQPDVSAYAPLPWFWSDQYACKLQIAGLNLGYTSVVTRRGSKSGSLSNWYFRDGKMIACDAMNDARSFMLAKRWLAADRQPTPEMMADPAWNPASF